MHPVEEKARLELIREGLKHFASGEAVTLRDCFADSNPKYRTMERKVVTALVERGVLDKLSAVGVGQQTRYQLKNAQELVRIVGNDIEVADLIWPGSKEPEVPPELPIEEPPPETDPVTEQPPDAAPPVDPMERMIVLFTAAMQSIIYMRDKIDAMEKKVDRLYADLTGEKS